MSIIKIKRIISFLLIIAFCLIFCSCSYISLDEISIVMGVAIDYDDGRFITTYEIIGFKSGGETEKISTNLVSSDGATLLEAEENAKSKLTNALFFPHMQVVIVCEKIAREVGLREIIDRYLKKHEARETVYTVISKEKTAKEILMTKPIDEMFVSMQISEILKEDYKNASEILNYNIYHCYNIINFKDGGINLVLPVFNTEEGKDGKVASLNCAAVFKDDKMVDFISKDESFALLKVIDESNKGSVSIDTDGDGKDDYGIGIVGSSTKRSFTYENNKLKVSLKVKEEVYIAEDKNVSNITDKEVLEKIRSTTEQKLEAMINMLIKKVQDELNLDILRVGNLIYKKDPKLWEKIKENENYLKDAEFEVTVKVKITNSAFMK